MSRKKIALALQGSGSFGAFTWGVLETLFSDPRIEVEGFSGTSSGGMNSTAAVAGLIEGGPEGAIAKLEDFWHGVNRLAVGLGETPLGPIGRLFGDPNLALSPATVMWTMHNQSWVNLSPYEINPFNFNPLLDFLKEFFDWKALRAETRWKLFLAATHVTTGKVKIFHNPDMSPKALMASACLPSLFQAVEVNGEAYWDGGFIANPAIFPLINECEAMDIVVVQLTPGSRATVPWRAADIDQRLREMTLNSCLIREIRAIKLITDLIDSGVIADPSIRRINLHILKDEDFFIDIPFTSSFTTEWTFLQRLREAGNRCAELWLADNFDRLGSPQPIPDEVVENYV